MTFITGRCNKKMGNIKSLLIIGLICLGPMLSAQNAWNIMSPDKKLKVQVTVTDSIHYQVETGNKELIGRSAISFTTDQSGKSWKISKAIADSHSGVLRPVVRQKSSVIEDKYSSFKIDFKNQLSLEWRVFDNGIAWRWINNSKGHYKVVDEQASINTGAEARAWYPQEDGFYSHNERKYIKYKVGEIDEKKLASLPVLFEAGSSKILLTESALHNYAGMWVHGDGHGNIRATFPRYPKQKEITSDRDEQVVSREDYIAQIDGKQEFPWRIVMIEKNDKDILINQLPYLLGKPQDTSIDFSWVKPGKAQWDWWHFNNVYNVNFKAGINNDTYKYYIDFASKHGVEYVLLDEGWSVVQDLTKQSKDIDIEELAEYAQSKNVGILLWVSWLTLNKQLDTALDRFSGWGIKGIKVDFMQRDDQDMVNYYERVSKEAAKRHLLVDFHGSYKPTGWSRTYPNVMTSEGVMGNEMCKVSDVITPEHTLTIPFIRMAAGPMDFTPGGMHNAQKNAFAVIPSEPVTLGTRCNQMAMYVVFESPLQMLCDIPTHYLEEAKCMQFLKAVPTVWQRTVPLQGSVSEYVAIARQADNNDWFVGAMTNWTSRDLILDLSFLGDGEFNMEVWKDGPNAERNAKDYQQERVSVNKNTKVKVSMAAGGGWVAVISKKDTGFNKN